MSDLQFEQVAKIKVFGIGHAAPPPCGRHGHAPHRCLGTAHARGQDPQALERRQS